MHTYIYIYLIIYKWAIPHSKLLSKKRCIYIYVCVSNLNSTKINWQLHVEAETQSKQIHFRTSAVVASLMDW